MPENPVSASPQNTRAKPLREEIARRAYQLWQENGEPSGRDEEFWLKAELQVLGADGTVRIDGGGAVDAKQYAETTDANQAKRTRKR